MSIGIAYNPCKSCKEMDKCSICELTYYRKGCIKSPASDVVEVVRCKDCKFNVANMEKDEMCINDYSGEDIVCSFFMTDGLEPKDYCSRGERRSE